MDKQNSAIQLTPAQKKRVKVLVEEFERAKADLDSFMEYVVEELDVPNGWTLSDLNVGFVPGGSVKAGVPNPYKKPTEAAKGEAVPFA